MKQLFIKNGEVHVENVPLPSPGENEILVQVSHSCISPGTEVQLVKDSDSGGFLGAIKEKPERLLKAYQMVKEEGLSATVAKVRGELNLGDPTGYSLSGTVRRVGVKVRGITVGDRVACAGAANAFHAEYVAVPALLTVPVPNDVSLAHAATVALGAIALQGVRRSNARLGEIVAVIGLGALGQITAFLLKQAGCRVIGLDLDPERIQLAREKGGIETLNATDSGVVMQILQMTGGRGVDSAIITAASKKTAPMDLAASICRQKGNVVVVGDTVMNLDRSAWYAKEMDLFISTSYGPGRYDPSYEIEGSDYPYGYIRWTEQRNMAAYLSCLADGGWISALIRETVPLERAPEAFQDLESDTSKPPLVLIEYSAQTEVDKEETTIWVTLPHRPLVQGPIRVALIGPGDFALSYHVPNFLKLRKYYQIHAVAGRRGANAKEVALRYGAKYATTEYGQVLSDPDVDLVFITTRHHLHAPLAIQAMDAGKAVFVEKPLAVDRSQLGDLRQTLKRSQAAFMCGFNRRFSPMVQRLKELLANRRGPLMIYYRVNTQALPPEHWVYGPEGGGRVIGEGCHFVDLIHYLVGSKMESVGAVSAGGLNSRLPADANFNATLRYQDGSLANLLYTSLGSNKSSKEYMELFYDGNTVQMDDFTRLTVHGEKPMGGIHPEHPDKGHLKELEELAMFLQNGGPPPIPYGDLFYVTRTTFDLDMLIRGENFNVPEA